MYQAIKEEFSDILQGKSIKLRTTKGRISLPNSEKEIAKVLDGITALHIDVSLESEADREDTSVVTRSTATQLQYHARLPDNTLDTFEIDSTASLSTLHDAVTAVYKKSFEDPWEYETSDYTEIELQFAGEILSRSDGAVADAGLTTEAEIVVSPF